ncbi:MAG TPA: zf-HC2 domain-containing protein [Candidatus Limnocylindria bacterium]|nr:zf-HC2 domain-containing protein [Candidatus Limnocylindria bacterium]
MSWLPRPRRAGEGPRRAGEETHQRARELISQSLDARLPPVQRRELAAHLAACPPCRSVERDYRSQQQALRRLPERIPPRDLWARTSVALDQQAARAPRTRDSDGDATYPSTTATRRTALRSAIAVAGMTLAIGIWQLPPVTERRPDATPRAMPVSIPAQSLALIASTEAGFAIYRTNVSQVCPAAAPDCLSESRMAPALFNVPAQVRPSNIAMSPSGREFAMVGHSPGGGPRRQADVVQVLLLPDALGRLLEDETPQPPDRAGETAGPATPEPDRPDVIHTMKPVTSPDAGPAEPDPAEPDPDGADGPQRPDPTDDPDALAILSILDGVLVAGAPPAWSSDGSMLAFSARPVDGSHGPDVYLWLPGTEQALPITSDHSSYFASWSGNRIVVSRATAGESPGEIAVTTLVIDPASSEERRVDGPSMWLPVVNAPGSHALAWHGTLTWAGPLVEPSEGALYVATWAGLDPFADEQEPEPTDEPQPADPSDQPDSPPSAEPTEEPTAPTEEATDQGDQPTDVPTDDQRPEPTDEPVAEATDEPLPDENDAPPSQPADEAPADETAEPAPAETAEPDLEPEPVATDDAPPQSQLPVAPTPYEPESPPPAATRAPAHFALVPVDEGRDPRQSPVLEWQVRWSHDGLVVGYWIADAPAATWGRLEVVALDPQTGKLDRANALLGPTLARRGFSIGIERVAWVAPGEDGPDGELRIRSWGSGGAGGLRLMPLNGGELVPLF